MHQLINNINVLRSQDFQDGAKLNAFPDEKWFILNEHFVATLFKKPQTKLMFSNLHKSNHYLLSVSLNVKVTLNGCCQYNFFVDLFSFISVKKQS